MPLPFWQVVFHVNFDNCCEIFVGLEAEVDGAYGIEVARPALDDFHDCFVWFRADQGDNIVACGVTQRLDLFFDWSGHPRQVQRTALAEACSVKTRSMAEEAGRRTR